MFDGNFSAVVLSPNVFQDPNLLSTSKILAASFMWPTPSRIPRRPSRYRAVPGAGPGNVDVFDTVGNLFQRLVLAGSLNAPWGLAIAPAGFGDFANDLLVGNFGDGKIQDQCVSPHHRQLSRHVERPVGHVHRGSEPVGSSVRERRLGRLFQCHLFHSRNFRVPMGARMAFSAGCRPLRRLSPTRC